MYLGSTLGNFDKYVTFILFTFNAYTSLFGVFTSTGIMLDNNVTMKTSVF